MTIALDGTTAGTLFIRTRDDRYGKIAFDPERLVTGSGPMAGVDRAVHFAVLLPFAYNPLPGRALPFDPSAPGRPVEPIHAALAADLPSSGVMPRIARSYRVEVRDSVGQVIDSVGAHLVPGVPQTLVGCPRAGGAAYRYENLVLTYGADGLPRVRVSVQGSQFVFHGTETLVSRRLPAVIGFHDFDHPRGPQPYELRLREVPGQEVSHAEGCP